MHTCLIQDKINILYINNNNNNTYIIIHINNNKNNRMDQLILWIYMGKNDIKIYIKKYDHFFLHITHKK